MPRRSVLFAPGDQPDKLRGAAAGDADVVVFDLEDAVAPANKAAARRRVREVLDAPGFDPDCEVCVRVNPGDAAADDLDAVLGGTGDAAAGDAAGSTGPPGRLDALVLPKATGAADVDRLAVAAAERGARLPVIALIESAAGVLAAAEVAAAAATTALAFGAEDFAADVGAERTPAGTEVTYARQRVVVAAAAAGVDAVDTLVTDYADDERLRADAERAVGLGYDGKLAIHPRQVPVIHEAFAPAPERVAWARRVLAARDARDGDGVFVVDGEMIDAPLVAQAERVLARADDAASGDTDPDPDPDPGGDGGEDVDPDPGGDGGEDVDPDPGGDGGADAGTGADAPGGGGSESDPDRGPDASASDDG